MREWGLAGCRGVAEWRRGAVYVVREALTFGVEGWGENGVVVGTGGSVLKGDGS